MANPFVPLRLTLTTGESVDIFDPGSVFIRFKSVYIFTINRSGSHIADDSRMISLNHIAQIEHLQPN
ncbi:MAG: hypothetical protein WD042_17745 [Phycisphaeraceae bacterium]